MSSTPDTDPTPPLAAGEADDAVDPRILEALATAAAELAPSQAPGAPALTPESIQQQIQRFQELPPDEQRQAVAGLQAQGFIDEATAQTFATIGAPSGSSGRHSSSPGGDALRAMMSQLREHLDPPADLFEYRQLGRGFTAPRESGGPAPTQTSTYFSLDHWHWLELKRDAPGVPRSFGPFPMHLQLPESQIIKDLTDWGILTGAGALAQEARTRIEAVTRRATVICTGTVVLHSLKRTIDKQALPSYVKEYNLEHSISDTPRVHISIGVTDSEVVSVVHNNGSLVWRHRPRNDRIDLDAADEILAQLDPESAWSAHPMLPFRVRASVNAAFVDSPDASRLLPPEPDPSDRSPEAAKARKTRAASKQSVTEIAVEAGLDRDIRQKLTELAQFPTTASATFTVTGERPPLEPGGVGLAFLDGAGIIVSYPEGTGKTKAMVYDTGTRKAIANGIESLRRAP